MSSKLLNFDLKDLKLSIPCLVDDMQNTAQKAYAGWPDRLYVLDGETRVLPGHGPATTIREERFQNPFVQG